MGYAGLLAEGEASGHVESAEVTLGAQAAGLGLASTSPGWCLGLGCGVTCLGNSQDPLAWEGPPLENFGLCF